MLHRQSSNPISKRLSREEKRRRRRASLKYKLAHATRERLRVEAFNSAFCTLRYVAIRKYLKNIN